MISNCPKCGAACSVADEPYCAYADCRWNNPDFGDSPPVNADPARVAPSGDAGAGVSTNPLGHSNRDKTGEKFVVKGCTCDWGGLRVKVRLVRLGIAYCETLYGKRPVIADCSRLRVVA